VNHRRPLIFHGKRSTPATEIRKEVVMAKKNASEKVKDVVKETGDKVKDVAEETIEQVEKHRVRSMLIVLLIAALTAGVWYLLSERD
jgi:hypothetical protein